MRLALLILCLAFPLGAKEMQVYFHQDSQHQWVWSIQPGYLTSGMKTELSIQAKVREGVEVNTSAELVGGSFDIHKVEHQPLRYEPPYWIHELKATLSTRLPGSYILPKHTLYINHAQGSEVLKSSEVKVKVHSVMPLKTKQVSKDHLKEIQAPLTNTFNLPIAYLVLGLLLVFSLYQLYQTKAPKKVVQPLPSTEPRTYRAFIQQLQEQGQLNEMDKQELYERLRQTGIQKPHLWESLQSDWNTLRYQKEFNPQHWLQFCQSCHEKEVTC